jgi:geranylgeranyl diphosphate synthase type I
MTVTVSPSPRLERVRRAPDLRDDHLLDAVEALMRRLAAGGRLERAGVMAQEHLATGGKRLRARLALAALEALGGRRADGVGWAAAVELLHNATLIHDDIQDGDRVRRGEPTTWVRHGVGQAINAGDLLLMLPALAIGETDAPPATCWALSQTLHRHAVQIVRGQSEEMSLLSSGRLDRASYRHAAVGKTAGLFTLPVEGAALLADRTPEEARALGDAFGELGLLFQLVDDVLDLYGDKGRRERGCDIREGKVSALVVCHLARIPGDAAWLKQLLETPREQTDAEQIEEVSMSFWASGALQDTLDWIQALVRRAERSPALAREPALRAVALGLAALACAPIEHLQAEAP